MAVAATVVRSGTVGVSATPSAHHTRLMKTGCIPGYKTVAPARLVDTHEAREISSGNTLETPSHSAVGVEVRKVRRQVESTRGPRLHMARGEREVAIAVGIRPRRRDVCGVQYICIDQGELSHWLAAKLLRGNLFEGTALRRF